VEECLKCVVMVKALFFPFGISRGCPASGIADSMDWMLHI
jgi:hypothetical protein